MSFFHSTLPALSHISVNCSRTLPEEERETLRDRERQREGREPEALNKRERADRRRRQSYEKRGRKRKKKERRKKERRGEKRREEKRKEVAVVPVFFPGAESPPRRC